MSGYDLERFSVLLAEDNLYLQSLMGQALRALGVGHIRTAKDGGEAIEILRLMSTDPVKAGILQVDFIMSNWQMSPVDGLLLLRWVRRHKESPNRFIPFVMVTGHADEAKVAEARAMGVTEILAKPFSVASTASRIQQIIERPRQFVHTFDYFGPDRRRRTAQGALPKERRVLTEDDIEIVYDPA